MVDGDVVVGDEITSGDGVVDTGAVVVGTGAVVVGDCWATGTGVTVTGFTTGKTVVVLTDVSVTGGGLVVNIGSWES